MSERSLRTAEKGSALVYILIAIALLGALTVTFMEPSSQQTTSQNTFRALTGMQSQIDSIRSAIQECVLLYPNGDSTIDVTGSGSDPDADDRYPINPDSSHYSAATPGQSGDREVQNARCPGNPTSASPEDHALLFGGNTGKFLGPPPDLFNDWQIYNGIDGVFYWTETDKSDAFIQASLDKLDAKFSNCEADVIDATGGTVAMDSAAATGVECPNGSLCFRVWVIRNASAVPAC